MEILPKEKKKQEATPNKPSTNTSSQRSNFLSPRIETPRKKYGWMDLRGSLTEWPPGLSVRPCNRFAQYGAWCKNTSCPFSHNSFPEEYSEADRKLLIAHEKKNPNFFFTKAVYAKLQENIPPVSPSQSPSKENTSNKQIKKEKESKKHDSSSSTSAN